MAMAYVPPAHSLPPCGRRPEAAAGARSGVRRGFGAGAADREREFRQFVGNLSTAGRLGMPATQRESRGDPQPACFVASSASRAALRGAHASASLLKKAKTSSSWPHVSSMRRTQARNASSP